VSTWWTCTGGAIFPDQIVVIDKDRIVTVGSSKETRWPRNAPVVINGKGLYLVPGLWDMHVHLVFGG
jgi:imidazolonepropionase-like amidohydrolase